MIDSGIDWEDAFANGSYIPGSDQIPERWAEQSTAFRAATRAELDIRYGDHPRERVDIFWPDDSVHSLVQGVVVFVHGGYWVGFDKSSWSYLAAGPLDHGWAVAMPSYTLAPEARISQISDQVGRAVTKVAELVDGPIRLSGHSAGGHLVTRASCTDSPLPQSVRSRIDRVVSISGVHDLRPLRLHSMNAKLQLDEDEAVAQSPVLHNPMADVELWAWVGGDERPEFLRQSAVLVEAWRKTTNAELVAEPGRHHFDVIDGLTDPQHQLTKLLTET